MNISHQFLKNNCISTEKIYFYENLPNRYLKIIKKPIQGNFHKKVMDWFFLKRKK